MNRKQAIALALGLSAGLGIVSYHWPHPRPRLVTTQTKATGEIDTTYESGANLWPPAAFGVVVVATGLAVYGLRRRD